MAVHFLGQRYPVEISVLDNKCTALLHLTILAEVFNLEHSYGFGDK